MEVNEEKIAIELAKNKPDYKAYQAVMGCNIESAQANAGKWMEAHPQVKKRAIEIVQNTLGMTLKEVIDVVKDGMSATYVNRYGQQIDWTNRHEAAKTLLRLHGELKDKDQADIHIDNRSVNISLTPEYMDMVKQVLNRFDKMKEEADVIDGEIVTSKSKDSNGTVNA
jgi:hypothetical protein